MTLTHITARLTREGRFWLIHVPEIDKYTQAYTVAEARVMARDLAAITLEVDTADVELDGLTVEVPGVAARADLDRAVELRAAARRADEAATTAEVVAAGSLRAAGLTVRDVSELVGVSYRSARRMAGGGSE